MTAAIALTAWSHLGRVRSEAVFAALAGTSPIPASSRNTIRHRLNRRGDRGLNRASSTATITRMSHDPRPAPTSKNGVLTATQQRRSAAASGDTWPARSTACSMLPRQHLAPFDKHRRILGP
ncbi:IS110 family transposase [Paenarthrobacter sp. MMS21-TAE1-1]|uniref:IS110 family transposase n=1 Tax=Paenarthrobacter aromaticivorans TaxID=2849150 RepID=A0ABS6ICE4_9MICC|nr:IS110 family transposase [Paenarthrobacter sp. MMS21-TAE1-1]